MRNIGLKVFSIGIALMLAWYVQSEGNSIVRTFVAPIELQRVPEDKVVLSPQNATAQVTIKGPSFLVSRVPLAPPVFSIGLPDTFESPFLAKLAPHSLALPPRVDVLNVEPAEVAFVFDSVVTKEVPVRIPQVGETVSDLKIVSVEANPLKVTARGPAKEVAALTIVDTAPLDLSKIGESVEVELPLRNESNMTSLSHEKVSVLVKVEAITAEKRIEQLPLEVRSIREEQYQVRPTVISVVVSGPKSRISGLKKEQLTAFVRIEREIADQADIPIIVEVPIGINVVSVEPVASTVRRLVSNSSKGRGRS